MRAAILHLSDIHFDQKHHPVLHRAGAIAAAVRSVGQKFDVLFIAVTGDIAYSGKPEEYKLAKAFFLDLKDSLHQISPEIELHYIVVPGNHDCNLLTASDVRQPDLIVPKLRSLNLEGDLLRHFIGVQTPFFEFAAKLGDKASSSAEKLFRSRSFVVANKTLIFNCFNTAWLTQNPEIPAKLYFPIEAIRQSESIKSADVSVSLFHHPTNWLEPSNAHEFAQRVESMSDLLLSGHEHVGDFYSKTTGEGAELRFIEAEPLWDEGISGFKLLVLDLDLQQYEVIPFGWGEGKYEPVGPSTMQAFSRNRLRNGDGIVSDAKFLDSLNEIGTGFTHPAQKQKLRLSDLFVYPHLQQRYAQSRIEGRLPSKVRGNEVRDFVLGHQRILITGSDLSGKTALAHTLYVDCLRAGLVPVLLDGEQLTNADERWVLKLIDDTYIKQYSPRSLQTYKQLEPAKRVFILDNFQKIKLKRKARQDLLLVLERLADNAFVMVDDLYPVEEIAGTTAQANPFTKYQQLQILPFSHSLTTKLIGRWVALSSDQQTSHGDLYRETMKRAKIISALLGKQFLPPYPIFILGILQAYETARHSNTANGSLGELYEALITERLALVSKNSTDLGTKYTYISRIAYYLFQRDLKSVSREDLLEISRVYFAEFDIHVDATLIVRELVDAQILCMIAGSYHFKYSHFYQFFVARYFRDNLQDPIEAPALRMRLRDLADRVYCEEYANVLIFFIYFTRDTETIEYILANAVHIYQDVEPCGLQSETDFLNSLYTEPSKPISVSSDLETNRERYHASVDVADEYDIRDQENSGHDRITYNKDLAGC